MSNEAITWAYAQATGSVGRKAVLVALADKADEAHSCWPKQSTLARMTDQSERSVRAHLAALEEAGLIGRTHQYRDGRRIADRYVLPVSVLAGVSKRRDSPAAKPAASQPADLAATPVELPAESVAPTGEIRRAKRTLTEPTKTPPVSKPKQAEAKRGTRLTAEWRRTPADVAWQTKQGIPDEFARPVTLEFVAYWTSVTGARAMKLDWSATWKGWMTREWRKDGPRWTRDRTAPPVRDFDAERKDAQAERARQRFASSDSLASAR